MAIATEPQTTMVSQLRVANISQAVGDGVAAAAEQEWRKAERMGVSLYAYMQTLVTRMGEESVTQMMGEDTIAELEGLLMRFKVDVKTARQLQSGNAVIVLYQDSSELQANAVRVGVYRAESKGDVGVVWAYVLLAAGATLVASYMVHRNWDVETKQLQEKTKQLALRTAEKLNATVARIAQTDPDAAARIAEAGADSIREATKAASAPGSWIDQMVKGFGLAAGVTTPIVIAFFLWRFLSERKSN